MATKVRSDSGLEMLYGDYPPYTVELKIRGVTAFLFNNNSSYEEEDPGERKSPRSMPKDFEEMVWRNDAGELALPTANIIASICSAGRYFKTPIGNKGSAKTSLTEALVPAEELASFGVKEWDSIDYRIAKYAGKSRAPKPTWRPRLEKSWELSATISVITPEIYSPSRVAEILAYAGRVCGVGDGRKIGCGRYVTVAFEHHEGVDW